MWQICEIIQYPCPASSPLGTCTLLSRRTRGCRGGSTWKGKRIGFFKKKFAKSSFFSILQRISPLLLLYGHARGWVLPADRVALLAVAPERPWRVDAPLLAGVCVFQALVKVDAGGGVGGVDGEAGVAEASWGWKRAFRNTHLGGEKSIPYSECGGHEQCGLHLRIGKRYLRQFNRSQN